jgi:hypothetical protein
MGSVVAKVWDEAFTEVFAEVDDLAMQTKHGKDEVLARMVGSATKESMLKVDFHFHFNSIRVEHNRISAEMTSRYYFISVL